MTRLFLSHFTRKASVFLCLAGLLSACAGGFEDSLDSISNLNPFGNKEKILPGVRTPLASNETLIEQEISNANASLGAVTGGDWRQPGANAANDAGHRAFASPPTASFRVNLGGGDKALRIAARPVAAGGQIFIYKPDGTVTALSRGGGRAWQRSLRPEGERQSTPGGGVTSDGQVVYVATGYRRFAALNAANGSEIWRTDLRQPARGAPTVAGDAVYFVTQRNEVVALSTADGSVLWRNQGIPQAAGVLSAASPAIANGKVVVPYSSGEIIAFDAKTGAIEWLDALSTGNRIMAISGLADVSGSPVIADGVVYATGVSGRTIAVKLANGERLWEQNIGSSFTPIVSGNAVFLVDINNGMTALNRDTGEVFWRRELPRAKKSKDRLAWVGPVLAGQTLYAFSAKGDLAQVDPVTGRLASVTSSGHGAGVQPIVSNGQMILVSTTNAIIGFR